MLTKFITTKTDTHLFEISENTQQIYIESTPHIILIHTLQEFFRCKIAVQVPISVTKILLNSIYICMIYRNHITYETLEYNTYKNVITNSRRALKGYIFKRNKLYTTARRKNRRRRIRIQRYLWKQVKRHIRKLQQSWRIQNIRRSQIIKYNRNGRYKGVITPHTHATKVHLKFKHENSYTIPRHTLHLYRTRKRLSLTKFKKAFSKWVQADQFHPVTIKPKINQFQQVDRVRKLIALKYLSTRIKKRRLKMIKKQYLGGTWQAFNTKTMHKNILRFYTSPRHIQLCVDSKKPTFFRPSKFISNFWTLFDIKTVANPTWETHHVYDTWQNRYSTTKHTHLIKTQTKLARHLWPISDSAAKRILFKQIFKHTMYTSLQHYPLISVLYYLSPFNSNFYLNSIVKTPVHNHIHNILIPASITQPGKQFLFNIKTAWENKTLTPWTNYITTYYYFHPHTRNFYSPTPKTTISAYGHKHHEAYKMFLVSFLLTYLENFVKTNIWVRVDPSDPFNRYWKRFLLRFYQKHNHLYRRFNRLISVRELLEIIILMYTTQDLQIFLSFVREKLEKSHFKKHKKILSIIFDVLRKNKSLFFLTPIKGFSFDIRGKVGVTGNAKKRHLFFALGSISTTSQNVQTSWQQINIWTPTGQMGVTCVLHY